MINRITRETWDAWAEQIAYYIDTRRQQKAKDTAAEIMIYLEAEGAFTLIDDESNV